MELVVSAVLLVVLVFFSGFFSGVETALFSLSSLKVKHLVKKGVRGATTVDKLKQNPQRLLITILIGNNVVNVAASVVATTVALQIFSSNALALATGLMTLFLLIFGEITPKTLATRFNQQIALLVARPLLILEYIFFPIIIIFESFTHLLFHVFGVQKDPLITEEELKSFAHVAADIGQIEQDEKELLMKVFSLNDLCAKDILIPLREVVGIKQSVSIAKVHPFFSRKRHVRFILFDDIKTMVGFIHIFDVDAALDEGKGGKSVSSLKRELLFVQDDMKLDDLLRFLQQHKIALAGVQNSKGKQLGIVALKDVLEELVGGLLNQVEPKE